MRPNIVTLKPNDIIIISGIIFVTSSLPIKEGDVVLDRRDGIYGYCEMIMGEDKIAIKHYDAVELNVPVENVYRLTPINPQDN